MAVRRPRSEDEEDVDTRRNSSSAPPWDEDPPRSRRRSTRSRDEDDDRPARSKQDDEDKYTDDDDDDYEAPRSSRVRRGWEAAERGMSSKRDDGQYSEPENFLLAYQASSQPRLIRFLDNQPMVIKRHYWDRGSSKGYYVCLEDNCPMCDAGHQSRAQGVFTVVDLTPDNPDHPPHRRFLYAGKRLLGQLRDRDDDPKFGPLTKSYMSISKSGEGVSTAYTVTFVKERDLEEDWDISPEDARDACEGLEPAGEEKLGIKTRRELREVVEG